MNHKDVADKIRSRMIKKYQLIKGDIFWEAYFKNTPIKIIGCEILHFNGTNKKGRHLLINGRFWIDNRIHKDLENKKGLYLFCVYRLINDHLVIINDRIVPVRYISPLIGKGKNSKIGWNKVFDLPFKME